MMKNYLLLAEKNGADRAEIFRISTSSFSVSAEGKTVTKECDLSEGYGLRVLAAGKLGFSYFAKGGDAQEAVVRALALSKFSRKTCFDFPGSARCADVDVFDKRVNELDEESGSKMLDEIVLAIEKPAKPAKCGVEFSSSEIELLNSSGLSLSEKSTHITCFAQTNAKKSGGSSFRTSTHLDFQPAKVGTEASERAIDMLNAKPAKGGRTPAVFEPEALYSLLYSLLLPSFHGERVYRKISKLHDKLGESIAIKDFTMSDDPLAKGPSSFSFDGEGTPGRAKALIKGGVVSDFLFDTKTAVLARGLNPTPGNCGRSSYLSEPAIGMSNAVVKRGNSQDALADCKNGILICSVFGEHTANDLTGEFSVSVDRGFRIENGEKTSPVRGNVISGNVFGLLNRIISIEKTQERYANLITPRIAFEEIQVVG